MDSGRPSSVDVGLTRITLPTEAGARALAWARALPDFVHASSIPFEIVVEAIRREAKNEIVLKIEREILKDAHPSKIERSLTTEYEP